MNTKQSRPWKVIPCRDKAEKRIQEQLGVLVRLIENGEAQIEDMHNDIESYIDMSILKSMFYIRPLKKRLYDLYLKDFDVKPDHWDNLSNEYYQAKIEKEENKQCTLSPVLQKGN